MDNRSIREKGRPDKKVTIIGNPNWKCRWFHRGRHKKWSIGSKMEEGLCLKCGTHWIVRKPVKSISHY